MSEQDDTADWGEALQEQADSAIDENAGGEEDPWGEAFAEQAELDATNNTDIDLASFDELQKNRGDNKDKVDLDVLLDIPVTLQLEIGRAKVSIRNLLSYTQGSVVEMDRLAGEPLDLLVNGTLIAHGEVVVINDKFGVRLTDVVSPQERIKKLK